MVEPHGLLCRLDNWYLTGLCMERQQRRVFLLLNIKELNVLERSFYRMPPGFSLKKAYQSVWGTWTGEETPVLETVRLKVEAGPAERFRHTLFHESQRVQELPGGEIEVTFRLMGAQEMISWLMSWGGAVEVIEPAWLRKQLIQELQKLLLRYQKQQ